MTLSAATLSLAILACVLIDIGAIKLGFAVAKMWSFG